MPLFCIRRDVHELTQADLDAAALRAVMCEAQFDGMKWLHSYLNRAAGSLDCYYEAASERDLRDHARVARIPCDAVWEVEAVLPGHVTLR